MLLGLIVAFAAAAPPVYLPAHCTDQSVKPAQVTPGCDQNRQQLVSLHWSRWGHPQARATGLMYTNTCVPDCPSGAGKLDAVRVQADHVRRCGNGRRQYTQLSWTFVADPAIPRQRVTLRCAA